MSRTTLSFIGFIVISLAVGMIPAAPSVASSGIRIGQTVHTTSADFATGAFDSVVVTEVEDGELELADGADRGQFTSPVLAAEFQFNAIGVSWSDEVPQSAELGIELRTSLDGKSWKDWHLMQEGDIPSRTAQHVTDLLFPTGSYFQYRVTLSAESQGQTPMLKDITIRYIDSTSGPSLAMARAVAQASDISPSGQPAIISRTAWGCQDREWSPSWPPDYSPTKVGIIHHTDTPIDNDPAAAVRAIWYYHTYTLGWGDIGYNYLVDTFGNIYEGRAGGDNVVAAHAGWSSNGQYNYNSGSVGVALIGTYSSVPASPQAQSVLVDLLAWKLNLHGIDPTGSGWFYDKYVNNIAGHRDVSSTACPGDMLYGELSGIRYLTKFREGWGAHNTPSRMNAGQTATVGVQVRNRGTQTWTAGGSNPFDLGYHWYYPNGAQYVQSPQDDHRASVPSPVAYGQWTTINIPLTAPRVPGTYTLQWDMVQENVAWLQSYGNTPLALTVVVDNPPTPTPTATPVPPTLQVVAPSIAFLMGPGVTPQPQSVQVQNAGTGTFSWQATASSQDGWLVVNPGTGPQPGTASLSVDTSALGPNPATGTLDGSVLVQASPGTLQSPQTVAVRLVIADQIYFTRFPFIVRGFAGGW